MYQLFFYISATKIVKHTVQKLRYLNPDFLVGAIRSSAVQYKVVSSIYLTNFIREKTQSRRKSARVRNYKILCQNYTRAKKTQLNLDKCHFFLLNTVAVWACWQYVLLILQRVLFFASFILLSPSAIALMPVTVIDGGLAIDHELN